MELVCVSCICKIVNLRGMGFNSIPFHFQDGNCPRLKEVEFQTAICKISSDVVWVVNVGTLVPALDPETPFRNDIQWVDNQAELNLMKLKDF